MAPLRDTIQPAPSRSKRHKGAISGSGLFSQSTKIPKSDSPRSFWKRLLGPTQGEAEVTRGSSSGAGRNSSFKGTESRPSSTSQSMEIPEPFNPSMSPLRLVVLYDSDDESQQQESNERTENQASASEDPFSDSMLADVGAQITRILPTAAKVDADFYNGVERTRTIHIDAQLTATQGPQAAPGTQATSKTPPDPHAIHDVGRSIISISRSPVNITGHFCDLFKGTHTKCGPVALKRPRLGGTGDDEDVIRRFEREAATWGRLKHRYILKFIGTFKRDGHLYLVSPFAQNGTLVEYVARNPETDRVRLLGQTAEAIDYLHTQKVVHGDIKAANILISEETSALLCDFGLTRMEDSRTSTSMKGSGSVRWMAPELWDNASKSTETDIYAFGMTIAEVLSGQVPLSHLSNNMAVMMAVMAKNERPPKFPEYSSTGISYATAWAVAEACWRTNPSGRITMPEACRLLSANRSAW